MTANANLTSLQKKKKQNSLGAETNPSRFDATSNFSKYPAKQLKNIELVTDQLYERWMKERSRLNSMTNRRSEDSGGSDSDPEEFLLNLAEISAFE